MNVKTALDFIKNNKAEEIWGYNTTWIEDADTTNFVLLAFFYNNIEIDSKIIDSWSEYQLGNQGFSTYKNGKYLLDALGNEQILNVDGWTNSHQCVSAVSFYFLVQQKRNSEMTEQLL